MILQSMITVPKDGSIILALCADKGGFMELWYDARTDFWCYPTGEAVSDGDDLGSYVGWVEIPANLQAFLRSSPSWEYEIEHRNACFAAKQEAHLAKLS